MPAATLEMAKKAGATPGPEGPRKGRPKAGGRITYRYAIAATPEYRAWMDSFMESIGESEATDVWRDAMRYYATHAKGFRLPPAM